MSIIDNISEGLSTVTKKLWLAAIPILLDLFLWLGPKMSIAPVIERTLQNMQTAAQSLASGNATDAEVLAMFDNTAQMMQETVSGTNFLALLAMGRLGVPSIAGLQPIAEDAQRVMYITGYGELFMWQIIILALGLWIACLFLGSLAQQARGEPLNPSAILQQSITHWLYLAAIFVPFGIMLVFAASFGIFLGPLALFLFGGIVWLMIYISFFPQAVIMAHETPLRALLNSFLVVRTFFWPTLGILILVNVLSTGLGLVWVRLMGSSSLLTLIAILANAIIGTGLSLAMFMFYRDRMASLLELQKQRSTV